MLRNDVLEMMDRLKLRGMLAVYDEALTNGGKRRLTPEKIILELLKAETAERKMHSIRYRMGQAKFPILKDLDSFNFEEAFVDEGQIRALYLRRQLYRKSDQSDLCRWHRDGQDSLGHLHISSRGLKWHPCEVL
jgi:hypothetical protein